MALLTCCSSPLSFPSDQRQWNKIIKHNLYAGNPKQALQMYVRMLESGYRPDNFTYPVILKAASHISRETLIILHSQAIKTGYSIHVFVQTALLNAYGGLGYTETVRKLFKNMSVKDIIAWNSVLDAYASVGEMNNATDVFNMMPIKDQVSFNVMISGYANTGNVKAAMRVFGEAPVRDVISWNSIMLAYTKAGDMQEARLLFDKMPNKNLVSWNTLIFGYLNQELYTEAIDLFDGMKGEGFEPNHITVTGVLSACAHIGLLEKGREVQICAGFLRLTTNPHVVTALIDMYSKCGFIEGALEVFYKSGVKDICCWNGMISGLAMHGKARYAIKLFDNLKDETSLKPDDITFVALLSAYSHAGLVDKGYSLFESLEKDFGLKPKLEHYGCIVDLLGRAGYIHRAYQLVKAMPFQPGAAIYGALLGACVIHNDLEMAETVAEQIITRGYQLSDGEYMMLANIYALYGKWEESNQWRAIMNDRGISKTAGYSIIEVNGKLVKFLAGG